MFAGVYSGLASTAALLLPSYGQGPAGRHRCNALYWRVPKRKAYTQFWDFDFETSFDTSCCIEKGGAC
jgi:hypothetical protein